MEIIFVQFVRVGLFQLIMGSKKTKESKTDRYIKEKREKVCLESLKAILKMANMVTKSI